MNAVKKLRYEQPKTKCPFHEEETPSFYIDWKTKTFHCFGCGVEGKLIKKSPNSYEFEVDK